MTPIHISTYAQHQRTMRNINRINSDINDQNQKIAIGQKALSWSDLRPYDTTLLQDLDSKISQYESEMGFFKDLEIQANVIVNLLEDVMSSIYEIKNTIMQAQNPIMGSYISLEKIADSGLDRLELVLNTTYNDSYIFSGTKTNTPPTKDLAHISNLSSESNYTNMYYHGNEAGHFLNAGHESFQMMIGALNLMKEHNISSPMFDHILTWLEDASALISENITIISYEIYDLKNKYHTNFERKNFLENERNKIIGIDFPMAVMDLQNSLLQLNATFKSTVDARVSLLDYLK